MSVEPLGTMQKGECWERTLQSFGNAFVSLSIDTNCEGNNEGGLMIGLHESSEERILG